MSRAWIFQGNPQRYDLDAALRELATMRWRVPQHTSEVLAGDPVVLWRAGEDAGIVGVARVVESPREVVPAPEEDRFDRGDQSGPTTRATLRVRACPFVSKEEVARLPKLAEHQIVTAPMGTVFALTDEQWEALRSRLPAPPEVDVGAAGWPAVFSWEQRTKSITPLPGGIDAYQEVLAAILDHVDATQPARDELEAWIASRFDVRPRRATLVAGFLARAGLMRLDASRVQTTPDAARWLADRDAAFLLAVIHARVRYVGEMLAHLDRPRSTEELLRHANEQYGMAWTSRGQVVRRRHLLGGLGAVALDDDGRLVRTPLGDEALTRLTVAAPQPGDALPEPPSAPAEDGVEKERWAPAATVDAETLAERLVEVAHDSANPDGLEQAVRDAFAFLGFDAVWYGGAGRTDVLLTAPLGAQQYRVIVDTKSTAREAVSDSQIDWLALDEHKDRYDADYAAVVAPAFRGGRLPDRARRERAVALLEVSTLADVIRQHVVAPLDLDVYRGLFDPDVGPDEVIDQADTLRRQLVLAAEILRQIARLEGDEGVVSTADLYWNLTGFATQVEGQRADREEIHQICDALAQPPLTLLRAVDGGYTSLGASGTVVGRLRLLADLVEGGAPETEGGSDR